MNECTIGYLLPAPGNPEIRIFRNRLFRKAFCIASNSHCLKSIGEVFRLIKSLIFPRTYFFDNEKISFILTDFGIFCLKLLG